VSALGPHLRHAPALVRRLARLPREALGGRRQQVGTRAAARLALGLLLLLLLLVLLQQQQIEGLIR
jgi:hypothetical protein